MELKVENQIINYTKIQDKDFISITDMLKSKDGNFFVTDWLRNIILILIMANSP